MKKALLIIGCIVASMLVGYGIGIGLSYTLDGKDPSDIGVAKMILALSVSLVSAVLAFFINTILHEVGHMIFGLLTGYKFLSFRVLMLTVCKDPKGFHFKKYNVGGTLGQCLMIPPATEPLPYFWYNAGGLIMNLLVIILSGLLIGKYDLPMVPFALCIMLLATAAWMFVMNGVPMTLGIPNDGKNILVLWRHPENRKDFYNMLAVTSEMYNGKRLIEMPYKWFESEPLTDKSDAMNMSARSFTYSLLVDRLEFDAAREITEEFMNLGDNLPMLFRNEVASDRIFLELATLNRIEVISELFDKKLQQYIEVNSKYSPLKSAVLFAYELVHNQNPEAAQSHYDKVVANLDKYINPGEARTAVAIMDELKIRIQQSI